MAHWLMKSEPQVYSIDDLARDRTSGWEGVRNYEARNLLRAMRRGDLALFYHSNSTPPAIVGSMEIAGGAVPDPTQFDPRSGYYDPGATREHPRWFHVRVRFKSKFSRPLPLDRVRREPPLQSMALLKRGRLSVQPVSPAEWEFILKSAV